MLRLVRAIAAACAACPLLNGRFDAENIALTLTDEVNLGVAMETDDGLFVPVLRNITERTVEDLRDGLNCIREDVKNRTIPPKEMTGATITLSNFGTIAGRYGNPIIVPPMVAILGAGKIYKTVVETEFGYESHRFLPLSFSFDHRVVTGGEAARFLKAVMDDLH